MQKTLGTSGAESLSAAANIFVGQTEAPLLIKPYIQKMTKSEIMAVMVGGFATIAGGVMAAYIGMGIDAGHLLTASVISAPAALVMAKIIVPETETPVTAGVVIHDVPKSGVNVFEAATIGASDGLHLALNVGAMLIAFTALIAMADAIVIEISTLMGHRQTLGNLLGYVFAPLAWVMGVPAEDCLKVGELLGIRAATNEFIAYEQMAKWMKPDSGVALAERSRVILTYALCGFANFASIGIQIGGIGSMVPERREDIARLGLKAMIGGMLACFMTACIAGMLIS
jgi:CNT family concentrative nucleoside transporter